MTKKTVFTDFAEKAINELLELVSETKSFLRTELPEVIRQLLLFKGIEQSLYALLRLLIVGALAGLGFYWTPFLFRIFSPWGILAAAIYVLFILAWSATITADLFRKIIVIVEIFVAPKIYLIEFLSDWFKKRKSERQ